MTLCFLDAKETGNEDQTNLVPRVLSLRLRSNMAVGGCDSYDELALCSIKLAFETCVIRLVVFGCKKNGNNDNSH